MVAKTTVVYHFTPTPETATKKKSIVDYILEGVASIVFSSLVIAATLFFTWVTYGWRG